jgi:hypothetical protein
MMQRARGKLWSMTVAPLCADSCGSAPLSGAAVVDCGCLDGSGGYVLCDKSGRNAWPQEVYSHRQIELLEYRYVGQLMVSLFLNFVSVLGPLRTYIMQKDGILKIMPLLYIFVSHRSKF